MNRLSRSTALKIAAVLMVLMSLFDIIGFEIPALLAGAEAIDKLANTTGGPPFFMVIATFTVDIIAIVAAYGAWQAQRWGVILLLVTAILTTIPALAGMLFAPDMPTRVSAGVGVILGILVVVLCLWRDRRAASNSVPA
jgi:hypothetical protein